MKIPQYIMKQRITCARRLMLGSDAKLETIARKCGFRDGNYCNTVFKRYVGVTPNGYRRMKSDGGLPLLSKLYGL